MIKAIIWTLALIAALGLGVDYYANAQITFAREARLNVANTWSADQTLNDNVHLTLGTGGDADLSYDATNLLITPDVAGTGAVVIGGTTPELTIGDAGAEDTALTYDGNEVDFYVGIDDTDNTLQIGLDQAPGTNTAITILGDGSEAVAFAGAVTHDTTLTQTGAATFTDTMASTQNTVDIDGGGGSEALAITSNSLNLTCTGAETILTITGGASGQILVIQHQDSDCILNDTDDDTANQMDLVGANADLTGGDDLYIVLYFNGTSWQELIRSQN